MQFTSLMWHFLSLVVVFVPMRVLVVNDNFSRRVFLDTDPMD